MRREKPAYDSQDRLRRHPGAARPRHRGARGRQPRRRHRLVRSVQHGRTGHGGARAALRAGLRAGDRRGDHRRRRGLAPADQMAPCRAPARGRAARRAPGGRRRAPRPGSPPAGAATPPPARPPPPPTRCRCPRRRPDGSVAAPPLRVITAADIAAALTYPALVEALKDAFRGDITVPLRHHHTVPQPGRGSATLLLMPAWSAGEPAERFLGCKIVTVFPDNAAAGQPSPHRSYLLLSGATGAPLALMDAAALTAWRTAAASALASTYLA